VEGVLAHGAHTKGFQAMLHAWFLLHHLALKFGWLTTVDFVQNSLGTQEF
jgi:hypothetical protein